MGTTWLTNLLVSLLYEYDDDGNLIPEAVANRGKIPGRLGQTYPEGMYATREEKERDELGIYARVPEGGKKCDAVFGDFVWEDLLKMPRPRMFVTHLFGRKYLPRGLFDEDNNDVGISGTVAGNTKRKGKGRLIVMVRNLKDSMCSLHNFRGTPMDGWLGNEHGPGLFRRWLMLDDCPNSMGSAFYWVRENCLAVENIGIERALVVHYEGLILNFGAQLKRINAFLGLPDLTEAKLHAIAKACSFKSMETSQLRTRANCRKGGIGSWKDVDLGEERWAELDKTFNNVLAGEEIADPMRFFQFREIPGMPLLSTKDCDLNTDPRCWPPPSLVTLREGMIVPDPYFLKNTAKSNVETTQFKSTIRPGRHLRLEETANDGSPRFHLFVAGSCPLASSVAGARLILGLEHSISMDVSDGQSGAGWVFLNGATCSPWKDREGPFWLYEAYQLADPLCTASVSVPLLWDTKTHKIVSNDCWEISKLISDASSDLGFCSCPKNVLHVISKQDRNNSIPTLFPDDLKQDIEQMLKSSVEPLLDAVETGYEYLRNGKVETPLVLKGRIKVFAMLDKLEELLGNRSYLLDNLTGVDVRLAFCLLQFDACYWDLFGLRSSEKYRGPILTSDIYPNLKAYTREMYQLMKPAVYFESFRQLYRLGQAIEFTRDSYSCNGVTSNKILNGDNEEQLPDLHKIVAALEMPK